MLYACNIAALLYLPLIYYYIPESPKWLAAAEHIQEAVAVLRGIEEVSSVYHSEETDDTIYDHQLAHASGGDARYMIRAHEIPFWKSVSDRARILLQFPYLVRTLMLWVVWSGMAMSDTTTLVYFGEKLLFGKLDEAGDTLVTYSSLAAELLGNLFAATLINRTGRRHSITGLLLVASAASLLEVYFGDLTLTILICSSCRGFAFTGAWGGCLFAYTPELYPISVRVIGVSCAWGTSRIGALPGPFAVVVLATKLQLSIKAMMWVFCGLSLFVVLVIFVFVIETATFAKADKKKKKKKKKKSRSTDDRTDHESGAEHGKAAYIEHEDDDSVLAATSRV